MFEGIKALAGGVPPELDSRMSKLIWSDISLRPFNCEVQQTG